MAIAKLVFDVPMNLGLPGLTQLARDKRIKIGEGRYVMFINRNRTKVKILFDDTTLFVYSKPSGRIEVEELKVLPTLFRGDWITSSISNQLEKWLDTPITPYSSLAKVA